MELITENLILRYPQKEDEKLFAAFLERNKEHLSPWENYPAHPLSDLLKEWIRDIEEGRSIRFFIFLKDKPDRLIGMINFTQIFRGAFQACYLGYKIDKEEEGKGLMQLGLKSALKHMFQKEKIHRIMSNFMPHNLRSASVLLKQGFAIEGYAKNYLKINGKWQDHILTSLDYERWSSDEKVDVKKNISELLNRLNTWENSIK